MSGWQGAPLLHYWKFSCTCTITPCYATGRSLALAPSRHATLLEVFLHFHHIMSCHSTGRYLALAPSRHATLLDVLLHLHHHVTLRYWKFSCTCTITSTTLLDFFLHFHITSCYASGRFLALSHHVMLLGLLSVMKSQADQYKGFKDHTLEWRLVELDLPVAMALQQSPQPSGKWCASGHAPHVITL